MSPSAPLRNQTRSQARERFTRPRCVIPRGRRRSRAATSSAASSAGVRAPSRTACYGAGGRRGACSPGGVARRAARSSASASYFTVTSAMCRRSASNWSSERFAHTPRSLVAASRMISPTRAARPASVFNGVWSSTRRSGIGGCKMTAGTRRRETGPRKKPESEEPAMRSSVLRDSGVNAAVSSDRRHRGVAARFRL